MAMEDPPFGWLILPGRLGSFHGYVSLLEGMTLTSLNNVIKRLRIIT